MARIKALSQLLDLIFISLLYILFHKAQLRAGAGSTFRVLTSKPKPASYAKRISCIEERILNRGITSTRGVGRPAGRQVLLPIKKSRRAAAS
jgi:hypothetical protein